MAIHKTECYIIRRAPLRETSWILTCLTKSFGKIKGVVKGARTEKSKWLSSCELFTHSKMVFYEKPRTNLHLITDLSVLHSHDKLRNDFAALSYAGYLSEVVDEFLEESHSQPAVFELFDCAVSLLKEKGISQEVVLRAFEIKLFSTLGILPRFADCLGCGEVLSGRIYFNPKQGGVYCSSCHERKYGGFLISKGCLNALYFLLRNDLAKASQLRLGNQIKKELEEVTKQFMEYRTEKPFRSSRFLSEVMPIIKGKNIVSHLIKKS